MVIYYFKSCTRCKTGDLYLDYDNFGAYLNCIQCGCYYYINKFIYNLLFQKYTNKIYCTQTYLQQILEYSSINNNANKELNVWL